MTAADMPARWRRSNPPQIFTGNELRDKEFPPIKWAIPGILPSGVTLFGGREKMGKSWLAFSLCVAVSTGGYALGKMPVEKGKALYLSLEDPERRLYKRLRRLASEDTDLGRLCYATEWNQADRGGVEDLDAWLEENEDCRLVVIDTLKRIRPQSSGKRNMYDDDYDSLQPYVPLASKHNVAIVVLHHLNQQSEPHDPFDAFSGSSGLPAATEQIWLLTRKRGDADAYLMIDGKDIEELQELALGWDAATCSWTSQGDAQAYRLSETRLAILRAFENADGPLGPTDVADILEQPTNTIKQRMYQMSKDGELRVESRGRYVIGTHNLHNLRNQEYQKVTEVTEVMGGDNRQNHDSNGKVMKVMEGSNPLSADEGNERVQRLVDKEWSVEAAIAEVLGQEL